MQFVASQLKQTHLQETQQPVLNHEREHVSMCTQLFLTLSVKQDELLEFLVRMNVRSIRSRAGVVLQVPVPWMTTDRLFTLLVCFQAIT